MFQAQRFQDLVIKLAHEPQFTSNEVRVLLYLGSHWTKIEQEQMYARLSDIMDATGIKSMPTLRAALDGLKAIGALEIQSGTSARFLEKRRRRANRYRIVDDPTRWVFPDSRGGRAAAGTIAQERQRKYEDAYLARKATAG